jgi:hypothetical protein
LATTDREFRRLDLERCRRDRVHWCNSWAWTFDPRNVGTSEPTTLPFDLFPKQVDFLQWLAQREAEQHDGLAEKSRDVGLTWLCVAYAVHSWLFRKGFMVGFGSHRREEVDQLGNPKTILEKARFLLRNLPGWMLPGYDEAQHGLFCRIINPRNGSMILGEGGDNIGRGNRTSIFFVDEAAHLEHPDLVDSSLSATTNVRIDVSTPNGPGNPFAVKRHSGRVPVFTFHWRSDPRKTEEWYQEFKRVKGPVVTASQLDIDYSASLEGICIPAAWVRAAVGLELPAPGRLVAGLDVAAGGTNRSVLCPRRGPVVAEIHDWSQCNTTETAHRAADIARKLGIAVLAYDAVGVGEGVRGAYESSETSLPFEPVAVNVGAEPSDTTWPDGMSSKEKFRNLRTELWWKLRCRFERSFEYVEKGVQHRPEEMISIPDHPELIAQLSLPLIEHTDTGKLAQESKIKMKARGVRSPDFADALALSLACDEALGDFWEKEPQAERGGSLVAQMPADAWGFQRRDEWDEPIEEREGESIFERMRREM